MTITAFDRSNLREIRTDIEAALAAVEQKHGIRLNMGNIRFDAGMFRAKLEAQVLGHQIDTMTIPGSAPAVTGGLAAELERMHGPGAAQAKYYVAGSTTPVTFVDYKPGRPKYPFVYMTVRGTRYKCGEATVRAARRVG